MERRIPRDSLAPAGLALVELLDGFRRACPIASQEVFRRFGPALLRHAHRQLAAHRTRHSWAADDLFQDTWLAVFKRLRRPIDFANEAAFAAFLRRTGDRCLSHYLRARAPPSAARTAMSRSISRCTIVRAVRPTRPRWRRLRSRLRRRHRSGRRSIHMFASLQSTTCLRRRRQISKPRASVPPRWVTKCMNAYYPEGVLPMRVLPLMEPLRCTKSLAHRFPRAALRLPWALICNAFGVKTTLRRNNQSRALATQGGAALALRLCDTTPS